MVIQRLHGSRASLVRSPINGGIGLFLGSHTSAMGEKMRHALLRGIFEFRFPRHLGLMLQLSKILKVCPGDPWVFVLG